MKVHTMDTNIWVGNLSAYVSGSLVGKWFSLDDYADVEELRVAVKEATKGAEELFIADYEAPFSIGDYDRLEDIWEHAQIFVDADEPDGLASFLSHHGWDWSMVSDFEDAYRGLWDSLEDYALDYYENSSGGRRFDVPGFTLAVDTSYWENDHYTVDHGRQVHVFSY